MTTMRFILPLLKAAALLQRRIRWSDLATGLVILVVGGNACADEAAGGTDQRPLDLTLRSGARFASKATSSIGRTAVQRYGTGFEARGLAASQAHGTAAGGEVPKRRADGFGHGSDASGARGSRGGAGRGGRR